MDHDSEGSQNVDVFLEILKVKIGIAGTGRHRKGKVLDVGDGRQSMGMRKERVRGIV